MMTIASYWKPPFAMLKQIDWLKVLVWPVIGLIFIALLWANTLQKIASEKEDAEQALRGQAVAAANSYAQQLQHMIEQISQITLRLKYSWEDPNTGVDLEKERDYGLYPATQLVYVNIFDEEGYLVTSSVLQRRLVNVAHRPYFEAHKSNCCLGLLISPPSPSLLNQRPVIRFTRRLNREDGTFAGLVFFSAEPGYLVAFQEEVKPGERDFISARLTTGPLLASKVGNSVKETEPFYRQDPIFDAATGVKLEPGEKFRDGEPRVVAWNKLNQYPVVALAGFSVNDAMAPFVAAAKSRRQAALLQTGLLIVLSVSAAYFSAKYVKRRRQSEEIQETYRLATDAANEGFAMLRPLYNRQNYAEDFRLENCNNRVAELLGTTREKLIGENVSSLMPEKFRNDMLAICQLALSRGFIEEEVRVPLYSPLKVKWIYRRIVRSPSGLAYTVRDISEQKEHEQALAALANTDTLTKLPNRNWLNQFLPSAVEHVSHRTAQLALLFIDLDNFKNVNDTLGHDAGDELLIQAAQRLRRAVRESDHVARLGGDEFVVILEQVAVVEDVSRVAKVIIDALRKPFSLNAGTGNEINASIGISMFPQDGIDAETLLKHADIAMYAAKADGKGCYAFYHAHLSDSLILRLDKERALREAVENDEFIVHYQPRVGIHTGQLTSVEALVRWERPKQRLVYPAEFIDIAEDIGLIVELGELVIEKVCKQLSQWKQQGLQVPPVSINVSPQQLKTGTLSVVIKSCLSRYVIEPSLIEIELTESAVIDRSAVVTSELSALRALGIKLMIDDFGTGYSSMAQLHRLDVDVLKVDQAFTSALSGGNEGKLLFSAITSMANALKMCVVAEGVETVEQWRALQAIACDEIQGHLVSEAVAASEITQLILKRFLLSPPRGPGHLLPV